MITTRKVLPIFLASPGDLSVERQYAKACVDEWNAVNEERTRWSVNLMGWEDTLPQAGRPQEIINSDVKRCAIFIGMMWRKWGSPTGNGFTSGFHEEFELARTLAGKQGAPRIAMFFKEVPLVDDPGDELKKVLAFKSEIIAGKALLFKELPEDADGWRTGFRQNVHRLIFEYIEGQSIPATAPTGVQPDAEEEAQPSDATVGENLALLRALIARCDGVETEQEVSRAQIAQLRLAALSWKRHGLSDTYLGTHDANIIYRAADELSLTHLEHFGLIEAGLSNLREQTAPIWKWLATTEGSLEYIKALALYGDDEALAVPAFQVLTKLKTPIGAWRQPLDVRFAELKPDVKKAAISYLARVGDDGDAPLLRAEIARADVSTRDAAATGLALIFCRESAAKALTFIIDELDALPRGLAFLLERFNSLGRDAIQRALSHRDSEVRATALRTLRELGGDATSEATTLRGDPSTRVRKEAVLYALAHGEHLTREDLRKIIVRKDGSSGNVFLRSPNGEDEFEEVERTRLESLGEAELKEQLLQFYPPGEHAYELLASRRWRVEAAQVRADVADDFAGYFRRVEMAYRSKFGDELARRLIADFSPALRSFRVKFMRRAALNVIVAKGETRDLPLVRSLLTDDTPVTERDLRYLAKHGEWSDIQMIAKANPRPSLLGLWGNGRVEEAVAKTICVLARKRAAELVRLDISRGLMARVITHLPKAEFTGLSNADILPLLNDQDADLRRVTAQKCLATLPRRRIETILAGYLANDYLFYNTIHWLDLGLSYSKADVDTVLSAEQVD